MTRWNSTYMRTYGQLIISLAFLLFSYTGVIEVVALDEGLCELEAGVTLTLVIISCFTKKLSSSEQHKYLLVI